METPVKRSRRTKIIATLGPASDTPEMIETLFRAGADVFRLNMSHLPREKLPEKIEVIRTIERELKRPIAILVDLQGPKLRVSAFAEGAAMLANGATFVLDSDPTPGDVSRVYRPHPEILSALEPGHCVIIDDGKLRLTVTEVSEGRAVTRVEVGGRISNRKGVSLPDTVIPVAAMTEKDRGDLEAGLAAGADWIAVSFVQRPEDVAEVKKVAAGRAPGDGQDREAAGADPPRGDHRDLRWAHGGARRPRRRDAAGAGARACRSASPAPRAAWASPWWSRRRCSNR